MIDSVVLKLFKGQYKILSRVFFDGREKKQVDGKFCAGAVFINKFREQKRKESIYFPVIQLTQQTVRNQDGEKERIESLELQFSLAKLLHQTNMWEVDETDEVKVYYALIRCLAEVKIEVDIAGLRAAILKRADFSKTIRLPDYFGSATQVIKNLSRYDYKQSSDFRICYYNHTETDISLKFRNKSQDYVIYAKLGEVINNGYTKAEQGIIRLAEQKKLQDSAIRFEISSHRKQSLNAMLKRLTNTKQQNYTLHDIMKDRGLARQVLLEAFDKVFSTAIAGLLPLAQMQENRLEALMVSKKICLKKRATLHYLVNMATKIGAKALDRQLKQEWRGGSYDSKKKELKDLLTELGDLPDNLQTLVDYLREKHEEFKLLTPNKP